MKYPALFLLLGFVACQAFAGEAPTSIAELFATPENLQLVRSADKVDTCILRHIEPAVRADGTVDRSTEHYEETPFVTVSADDATALRTILLNPKTYDWKAGSGGRKPQFYLRLRFHRGEEAVNVDFCFMCHVLNVTHKGTDTGHANFKHNSDLFLQIFMKLFPQDAALKQVANEVGLPI